MRNLSQSGLAAMVFFLLAGAVSAQTSYSGTVDVVSRDSLVVSANPFDLPMHYNVSARLTTYLDETGKPISADHVKQGSAVTVYYDTNGAELTATKVVVRTHP